MRLRLNRRRTCEAIFFFRASVAKMCRPQLLPGRPLCWQGELRARLPASEWATRLTCYQRLHRRHGGRGAKSTHPIGQIGIELEGDFHPSHPGLRLLKGSNQHRHRVGETVLSRPGRPTGPRLPNRGRGGECLLATTKANRGPVHTNRLRCLTDW